MNLKNRNTFGNIMDTIKNPRPVNVFLFVIPICVLATVFISVLLICCCECLKEKRFVYINRLSFRNKDHTPLVNNDSV